MLKPPVDQVAGHQAGKGKLGPLVDDSGCFYKPLQSGERGAIELSFYTSFTSNKKIPNHISRFFPAFHGTKILEASDGTGPHTHLVMQDILSGRVHPSIMDIKMGSRTWYPEASDEYIEKCFKKDKISTSPSLGFRISGLQAYINKDSGFWKPEKKLVQKYSADDTRLVLRKFVSSNISADGDFEPDCSFAPIVYGGSAGILAQLLELKAWFEDQTIYQLNSCSVLLVYEKEMVLKGSSSNAEVKLVDFAHVIDGNGVIDHNFLGALCSLIKFIKEILDSPSTEENQLPSDNQ